MVTYKKITYDSSKVQVESAIRDGNGAQIDTNYVKKSTVSVPSTVPTLSWSGTATIGSVDGKEFKVTAMAKPTALDVGALASDTTFATINGTSVKSNTAFTLLTSHQSIKTINNNTITGTGNVSVGTVTTIGTLTANQIAVWNANSSTVLKSVAASSLAPGVSIATDTGTNALTLAHSTKYKLTVGASTFIFTTPSDNNTDTKVTQVLKTDNYDRPLLMSDQIISVTTGSVTGEARRNNSIYANTSTGKITSTLIGATQIKGGLTKTYEIQATGYKTILQMKDATTYWTTNGGHSFVRYLIEYSTIAPGTIGTTGMKSGSFIVDSVFSGVNGGHRITSMNANAGTATGVMRYFRAFSPKNTSYCPQICVALQDATTKVYVTVTILSASDGWQLPATFGGDPGTTNYNQWSAEIGRYNYGWESVKLWANITGSCDGTASSAWDALRNDRYVFGESAVAGSIMAMATDGRMYKLRNGANKVFSLPLHCGRCTGTFTYNGSVSPPTLTNYAQIMWNMRSQSYAELTNATMQGTAFTVPTLTAGQYGLPLYVTGTLSGSGFVPDGNIVTAMVNGKTNIQIGRIDRSNTALNAVPTVFTITGYGQNAYTLDSNGKLTHIDGKQVYDSGNSGGTVTQVKVGTTAYNPSSGVVSLPAYPSTSGFVTASGNNTFTGSNSFTGSTTLYGTTIAAPSGAQTINVTASALYITHGSGTWNGIDVQSVMTVQSSSGGVCNIHTSTSAPTSSDGANGDIWIQYTA